ncbi:hypothetical protein FV229_00005, partial [Methylobacterium sp. WL120]
HASLLRLAGCARQTSSAGQATRGGAAHRALTLPLDHLVGADQFYTDMRKRKREVEDADGVHASKLTALPDQEGVVNLRRLRETLDRIPEAQRSALLLVGAEGYTYEEAAERLQCAVGTVKSRVSRARAYLSETLGLGGLDNANVAA